MSEQKIEQYKTSNRSLDVKMSDEEMTESAKLFSYRLRKMNELDAKAKQWQGLVKNLMFTNNSYKNEIDELGEEDLFESTTKSYLTRFVDITSKMSDVLTAKEELKKQKAELKVLEEQLTTGMKKETVECFEYLNMPHPGQKTVIRTDTNEEIGIEAMQDDDENFVVSADDDETRNIYNLSQELKKLREEKEEVA